MNFDYFLTFQSRSKPELSPLVQMKLFCKGLGIDPEKALVREAFAEPHRVCVTPENLESSKIQTLTSVIKERLKEEILSEFQLPESEDQRWKGGPVGI